MFEFLRQPGFFGTHATMGADLSQLMATLFTGLFIVGWVQAKQHRGHPHHWLMLGGMITMVGFFTAYYLFRQLGVLAFEGKEGFGGSQALYDYVFIPVLTIHIILVIIGLVMAVYMIVLGFRSQQFIGGSRVLSPSLLLTSWKKVGLIFAALLTVVIVLFGTRVMSAGFSMRKLEVYLGFLSLVAIVFAVEMGIQRIWPDGGQRHRALGRFTWPFYFVITVLAAVLVDRWSRGWSAQGRKWPALACTLLLPASWVIEGHQAHTQVDRLIAHGNVFNASHATPGLQAMFARVRSSEYQALLPMPFFDLGSESFSRPIRGNEVAKGAMSISLFTGLPIMGSDLSRVPVPESKMITQVVSPRFYPKALRDTLRDPRPLLVLRAPGDLTACERDLLRVVAECVGNAPPEVDRTIDGGGIGHCRLLAHHASPSRKWRISADTSSGVSRRVPPEVQATPYSVSRP